MLPKEDLKIYIFLISFKKLNNIFNNFIYSKFLKIYIFLISFKKLNNIFNNFIYSKLWYSICGDLVIKLR
jgi:hypothetical protein